MTRDFDDLYDKIWDWSDEWRCAMPEPMWESLHEILLNSLKEE